MPVAVNLSEIRNAKGAGGDLFRSVQRQKDQYQGLWLIAPDGRVLAAHHAPRSPETWTAEVRQTIRSALAAITLPTPRTDVRRGLLKDRGRAVHSDGSVRLALSVRLIFQGKPEGEGAFDGIRLSAPDWSEFFPPRLDPRALVDHSRTGRPRVQPMPFTGVGSEHDAAPRRGDRGLSDRQGH